MKSKILSLWAMMWCLVTHRITIYATVICSLIYLGYISAYAFFEDGAPEEHLYPKVGICLTVIVTACVLAYIRDVINKTTEKEGD